MVLLIIYGWVGGIDIHYTVREIINANIRLKQEHNIISICSFGNHEDINAHGY